MAVIDNNTLLTKTGNSPKLEHLLSDLQGNILKSHARPNVILLFLSFQGTPEESADWLRSKSEDLTSTRSQLDWSEQRKTRITNGENEDVVDDDDPGFMSISLSAQGYNRLSNINIPNGSEFASDFRVGTDPQPSDWETAYQREIHAVVILAKSKLADLQVMENEFVNNLPAHVTIIHRETGKGLKNSSDLDIEHFGFVDGRSQPRYFSEDLASKEPTTANWDPSAFLPMVLAEDPNGKSFSGVNDDISNDLSGDRGYGSYLVFRKLEQDVAGWDNAVINTAANHPSGDPDLIGAFAVGRFKDGTPVSEHANAVANPRPENDFVFVANDGSKCPFHAHIRKTNPRGESPGGITFDRDKVRLTRRGIPYGDPQDIEKGLLFMSYQSDIKDQFEFMQSTWADNVNFLNPGTQVDSVIGQGSSIPEWPNAHGQSASTTLQFGNFVSLKGAAYFFTPSISFFRSLPTKGSGPVTENPPPSNIPWGWLALALLVILALIFLL